MAVTTYVANSANARHKAVQRFRHDDPKSYVNPVNKRVDSKFTLIGMANELCDVIDSESVGRRVQVKNTSGGTWAAGTLLYLGNNNLTAQTSAVASNNPAAGAGVVINVTGSWEVGMTVQVTDGVNPSYAVITAVNAGVSITVDLLFYSYTGPTVTALPAYIATAADQSGQNHAEWVLPTALANNGYAYAYDNGEVTGLNTNALNVGNLVYLSTVGAYTTTVPSTGMVQVVGVVKVKSATVGSILFFPGNKRILSFGASSLTAGTSGQILMSNATPTATWTTMSGDGTISATGVLNVTSVSHIATGTLTVSNGGTGLSTTTAYGVICGGTTATGNFQNAGTGTVRKILVSSGSSALPAWALPSTYNQQTTNYLVVAGDDSALIDCDSTGGNIVVTLGPAATLGAGFKIWVRKADGTANTVTITANAADGIELGSLGGSYVISSGVHCVGLLNTGVAGTGIGKGWSTLTQQFGRGSSGNVLMNNGGELTMQSISGDGTVSGAGVLSVTSVSHVTTGTLASGNGGTGFSTYTTGDLVYASATNTLSKLGIGTQGKFLQAGATVPGWAYPITYDSSHSADFTIANTANYTLFDVTAGSSANINVTLPKASTVGAGFKVWIRKADAGTMALNIKTDGTTPDTINGVDCHTTGLLLGQQSTVTNSVQTMTGQYAMLGFVSTGSGNSWITTDCSGENLQVSRTTSPTVGAAGNLGDVTNFTLPPGEWDLSGLVTININGATLTAGANMEVGISTTSGNSGTGLTEGENMAFCNIQGQSGQTDHSSCAIPPFRVLVTAVGGTTFYLKIAVTGYSVATPTCNGRMTARRIR